MKDTTEFGKLVERRDSTVTANDHGLSFRYDDRCEFQALITVNEKLDLTERHSEVKSSEDAQTDGITALNETEALASERAKELSKTHPELCVRVHSKMLTHNQEGHPQELWLKDEWWANGKVMSKEMVVHDQAIRENF